LAGIDGTIATATGVALAEPGIVRALMGDLTFLHDASSLAVDPLDGDLNIQIFVVNDHGGSIFKDLEPSKMLSAETFKRLFETPQTANISGLAKAYSWNYRQLNTVADLNQALVETGRWVFEIVLN
jgi:2-succinyl-5-enolpyruvyl-6-hydroxy-3-cyclohexene-1-carboxylate synthase